MKVRCPESNGKYEDFFKIEKEHVHKKSFLYIVDSCNQIEKYINNTKRLHNAINYFTPEDILLNMPDERRKK